MLLINKYAPTTLSDFNLPSTLISSINTLIQTDCLNMLLVGNMGSGKTSMIHAIIREYYGDHYGTTAYKQNVLNVNNLYDQGISYYRNDVKIFCQTSSMIRTHKKVIIIDDIDLIPEPSQQAIRNSIDKYNHSVCFIFTCNNIQKVNESIQSRLSMIKIPPITSTILRSVCNNIIKGENINISPDAQKYILMMSNNTIKNMINYLEKCKLINSDKITIDNAMRICSDINLKLLDNYTVMVKRGQLNDAIQILYSISDEGYSVIDILDNYFDYLKTTPILNENEKYKIFPFICEYITVFHNIHESDIELALFTNNLISLYLCKG